MTSTETQTKVKPGLSNFVFFAKVHYQNKAQGVPLKRRSEARIGLDFMDKRCMKVHPRVVGYDSVGLTVGESKLEFGGSSRDENGFSRKSNILQEDRFGFTSF